MGEVELLHRNPSVAAVNRILDNVHNDTELSLAGSHNWTSQSVNFHEKMLEVGTYSH
jgi:hypothetical protein